MKKLFRKAVTVLGSVALVGATIGGAAAAAYPAPFSAGDYAVVYGSSDDMAAATTVANGLPAMVTEGATTVTGGDSVLLERSSDKLNLGNSASTVFVTSVDVDDMPNLLADGTYSDDDNTEYDYTQKITLGSNLGVEHFSDSDYEDKAPTVGIKLSDDEHVLNYTLDFTTHPAYNASTMETTTLTLMGKEYYVLDVVGLGDGTTNQNKTTLLDSANSVVITEGESITVGGKTVSIEYVGQTETRLTVDGETTNSLAEGATYKLTDGTYVGVKDILYDSKTGSVSKVEISLGTGKLELAHGSEIELNDDTVEEIKAFMVQDADYKLDKIVLQWTTDDEVFLAQGAEVTMPGFEAIKLSISDLVVDAEEETTVDYSGSDVIELKTVLEDGAVTIPLLYANSTGEFQTIGKSTTDRLVTTALTDIFFNETAGDKYIVASWNSSTEAESYYLKIDMVTEDSINKVRFTNEITDATKTVSNGSDATYGSVTLTVNNVTRDGSNKWANISINSGGSFHRLYTKEGLQVILPYYSTTLAAAGADGAINISANATGGQQVDDVNVALGVYNGTLLPTAGHGYDSFYLFFAEENKDGDLAAGTKFNVTLNDASDKVHVSTVNTGDSSGTYGYEIDDTDDYQSYVNSDLATKTLYATGGDQDNVVITYHGEQAYVELRLTAPEATVTAGVSGQKTFMDTEASSYSGKNIVVVGGSCVNAVAAELLGSTCGDSFTGATGVGAGQFLIESFDYNGQVATVVAGYEKDDTAHGATYLANEANDVSTEVGAKYVGTSATEASLVVA